MTSFMIFQLKLRQCCAFSLVVSAIVEEELSIVCVAW